MRYRLVENIDFEITDFVLITPLQTSILGQSEIIDSEIKYIFVVFINYAIASCVRFIFLLTHLLPPSVNTWCIACDVIRAISRCYFSLPVITVASGRATT